MRVVDLWFGALWALLFPTSSSLALATAKSSGLFGIPSGGSTSTKSKMHLEAASVDAASADSSATVSNASVGSSEVCTDTDTDTDTDVMLRAR